MNNFCWESLKDYVGLHKKHTSEGAAACDVIGVKNQMLTKANTFQEVLDIMKTYEDYTSDDEWWLSVLPYGAYYDPPERIVCAANKYCEDGAEDITLLGVRHCCSYMNDHYDDLFYYGVNLDGFNVTEVQGFITNKGRFVDRKEAWKIALEQRQIVRLVGSQTSSSIYDPDTELFSENLY